MIGHTLNWLLLSKHPKELVCGKIIGWNGGKDLIAYSLAPMSTDNESLLKMVDNLCAQCANEQSARKILNTRTLQMVEITYEWQLRQESKL